jgi:hypothetical protein
MGFQVSRAVTEACAREGAALRLEVRPGPQHARPMPLDLFFEEGRPPDHVAFAAGGVTIWVPLHLTWLADNEVVVELAGPAVVTGRVDEVRPPY